MPNRHTTRKLEVYALHARIEKSSSYEALFNALSSLKPEERYVETEGRLIAIPVLEVSRGKVWLIAYEGDTGVSPLIFNSTRAQERIQHLRSGEIVANKTHGLIDLSLREAVIEYNHRGAKAGDLANVLERSAHSHTEFSHLSLELNPVADEEFIEAINNFRRVRVASIKIARPNFDWTDHYNSLTELAASSKARTVDISLTAGRSNSLSMRNGIVQYIKDLATDSLTMIKGARITGVRKGEEAETAVSLAHHIEHQKIQVALNDDGHVDDGDLKDKMMKYLNSRRERKL